MDEGHDGRRWSVRAQRSNPMEGTTARNLCRKRLEEGEMERRERKERETGVDEREESGWRKRKHRTVRRNSIKVELEYKVKSR